MPQNRTPEDVQPLARPVHEQGLARPVGGEQEKTTQVKGGEQQPSQVEEEREAPQGKVGHEEKGLIDKAIDRVDEAIHKARNKLADI
jgi:hypothetical protein